MAVLVFFQVSETFRSGGIAMSRVIRVIECGGQGPRAKDVDCQNKVIDAFEGRWPDNDTEWLKTFGRQGLSPETEAIIYSVAGMVKDHSTVVKCPNIHLLDGAQLGNQDGDIPSFVCNDMESSVTGMHVLFPELDYFMGITRSSGIGVRIWKNGEILSDSEGGHMCVDPSRSAPVCGCERRGCAEAIFGGEAMTRFIVKKIEALGAKIPKDIHPCGWLDICYNKKEPWATNYYEEVLAPAMGIFLANIQALLRLPAIVWKGKLGLRSFKDVPQLESMVREEMKKRIINPAWVDELKFYFLECPKDHDAYIGAAEVARNLLYNTLPEAE